MISVAYNVWPCGGGGARGTETIAVVFLVVSNQRRVIDDSHWIVNYLYFDQVVASAASQS